MSASRTRLLPLLVLATPLITACTVTDPVRPDAYVRPVPEGARVLLMTPDIECSAVLTTGLVEPNAAWTAQAERHVQAALRDMVNEHDGELIAYDEAALQPARALRHRELSRLFEAVALSTALRSAVPTAKDKRTWTLGPGVRDIAADFDADYALFVVLRDQYATAGRIAVLVTAAAFGVGMPVPVQQGYASLVDLESGDIVWFNRLFSETGDLREADEARESLERLLEGCPVT